MTMRCIKRQFAKVRVKELKWPAPNPDLNPTEDLDLGQGAPYAPHLTSLPDLTNPLVSYEAGFPHSHTTNSSAARVELSLL